MTKQAKFDKIVEIVKSNKTISKHLARSFQTEQGDKSIIIWGTCAPSVQVYVDTDKKIFEKTIAKIKQEHKDIIKDMYFCKADGSCSSWITIRV